MDQPWRLHLANRTIRQLNILSGIPDLLAVWFRWNAVAYYDLISGAVIEDTDLDIPDSTEFESLEWQNFSASLRAPNQLPLPCVEIPTVTIYSVQDGTNKLYHTRANELIFQQNTTTSQIDVSPISSIYALAFDTFKANYSILDSKGSLHIFSKDQYLSCVDLGIDVQTVNHIHLCMAQGGQTIVINADNLLLICDGTGKIKYREHLPNPVQNLACSDSGRYIVTSDIDTSVLRVYETLTMRQTHQRFAVDLIAAATQLQLMADFPPISAAVNALTINDHGIIAFAIHGVICVSHLSHMTKIPDHSATSL